VGKTPYTPKQPSALCHEKPNPKARKTATEADCKSETNRENKSRPQGDARKTEVNRDDVDTG